jgi:hypothetical protein
MRIPNENLDDFFSNAVKRKPAEPQRAVSLEFSGEIEILKPLATWEDYAISKAAANNLAPHRLSWFHRSLAFGGALTVIALILGSGVYLGIFGPPAEVATNHAVEPIDMTRDQPPEGLLTPADEPETSDLLPAEDSPSAFFGLKTVPRVARRRSSRPRVHFAAYRRPRRHALPQPQYVVSDFVPTTLIIYVENGVIRTRIEPRVTASYKRPAASSN